MLLHFSYRSSVIATSSWILVTLFEADDILLISESCNPAADSSVDEQYVQRIDKRYERAGNKIREDPLSTVSKFLVFHSYA